MSKKLAWKPLAPLNLTPWFCLKITLLGLSLKSYSSYNEIPNKTRLKTKYLFCEWLNRTGVNLDNCIWSLYFALQLRTWPREVSTFFHGKNQSILNLEYSRENRNKFQSNQIGMKKKQKSFFPYRLGSIETCLLPLREYLGFSIL
jgi:hypothetical protein